MTIQTKDEVRQRQSAESAHESPHIAGSIGDKSICTYHGLDEPYGCSQ